MIMVNMKMEINYQLMTSRDIWISTILSWTL